MWNLYIPLFYTSCRRDVDLPLLGESRSGSRGAQGWLGWRLTRSGRGRSILWAAGAARINGMAARAARRCVILGVFYLELRDFGSKLAVKDELGERCVG